MKELLVFSASWCGPCQSLKKALNDLNISIENLRMHDIDESQELVKEFGIRSVPTLILIEDGKELKRKTGAMTKDQLIAFVE